ncbi:exosome complex exonuclease Rrp41 [Candidatus Pacearchaeota archaeon ex4484_71]|nr:MAG: exosome complex exonuclease Rrp41 [Candidatus Pacearchaeota archaeon ex4484_71]
MSEFKRPDGRKNDELRPIEAKVGIIPNADGSAMYRSGDTVAIAAVYGPKKMHPQHQQDPSKGKLRCTYNMLSFSVSDRIRPGLNRRSTEIGKITEWALDPVLDLSKFPNMVVDVHIHITQADAGTRCAGINAASMALAQAGLPMKDLVTSVAMGKLDRTIVVDLTKEEEDWEEGEGPTDIPLSMTKDGKITHLQLDGKISPSQLKEAIDLSRKACAEVYEIQKKALKEAIEKNE